MNKQVEVDLKDLADILDGFVIALPKMSEKDKIDLAARLKPVAKSCKTIDDDVKGIVKEKLRHKEGSLTGNLFKAVLKLVPTSRLDQKLLAEEKPKIFEAYKKEAVDERVTFELR